MRRLRASASASWTDWGEEANENCEGEGDNCSPTFSGDCMAAPACLGKAVLDVDDGRDILAAVEVERWTE